MKKILTAYWYKDGLDVYRYDGGKPVRYASGSLEQLQPIRGGLHKMVLIIGRERLMHIRKRYPLAPIAQLTKAVGLEIKDLFPLSKPAFYCRIARTFSTYTDLDIWAWESDLYEQLTAVFPFHYAVPEDLAFEATEARIRIYPWRDRITLVAHEGGRFLDGQSFPAAGFDGQYLSRFLFRLAQSGEEMKKIFVYGLTSFPPAGFSPAEIIRMPESPIPPCIPEVPSLDLRAFRVGGVIRFAPGIDPMFALRIGLYLVLGYALMLSLTWSNYDQALRAIRGKTGEINKKLALADQGQPQEDYSTLIAEVNAKLKTGALPLKAMNLLARRLPEGSFINRIVVSENGIEVAVSSKDPLAVVKALGADGGVRKVNIKGAPTKDGGTGSYNFLMTMELH